MDKIRITQIRSVIDRCERQKRTMVALGLTKINKTVEHKLTDTLIGMISKVAHLVVIENK